MSHSHYMQQALELAKKGFPNVAPNPMVGCVIVHNEMIVASGYHQKFGEAHAEVNAINALPDGISPADCELYVTLEPCSHHGKTPPCADLIIARGFKKVMIACKDPNPAVAGKGIEKLQNAGINVINGILEDEARELNKKFITFHERKRPYYILKWAQTADNFISRMPVPEKRSENQISGQASQLFVHQLRAENSAILVGKNTVLVDNPSLTTRLVEGKNPTRVVIDKNLEIPTTFNIYNIEAKTIVFNAQKQETKGTVEFIKIDFTRNSLAQISEKLVALGIQSVLVEGGSVLLQSFIKENNWDELYIFQNPNLYFNAGIKAPEFKIDNTFERVGDDKLFHYLNQKSK